jgi:hypothetical protein
LISYSSGGRPGAALPRKMTSQSTLKTSSTSAVSLRWCTVRGWGIGAGALLYALAVHCVHHLMVWEKGKNEIPRKPTICTRDMGKNAAILFILI